MFASANNVSESIEIQKELSNVIYELEKYERQLLKYDELSTYCTINLRVDEKIEIQEETKDGVFKRMGQGFVSTLKFMGEAVMELFVFIASILPVLIIPVVVVLIVVIISVKRNKRKKK